MSNTKLPAQANWMERFEELLEDYAGARAEVAHFNATQQSGMKVRLPRPRLKALMDHVADRERQAGEAVAQDAFTKALSIRTAQGWSLTGKAVPVLYTDAINGEQVCRDDLWLCTTSALASLPVPQAVQAEPMRAHVEKFAAGSGWVNDGAEGAFEFVQRKCYHQGWQDGRREALGDVHRDTPEVAGPSPDGKAEQAEAPSDTAREVLAAGIVHHYGVPEGMSFACARQVLGLTTQPTASNAGEGETLKTASHEIAHLSRWKPDGLMMVNDYQGAYVRRDHVLQLLVKARATLASKPPQPVRPESVLKTLMTLNAYRAGLYGLCQGPEPETLEDALEHLRARLHGKPPAGEQKPVAQAFGDLSGVQVCCGEYAQCHRPCTPRGRWEASREQPEQVAQDSERWKWIANLFDHMKRSRSENMLDAMGLGMEDPLKPLAEIVDEAIRAARARVAAPTIKHLPSDDTEGGGV